MDWNIAGWSTDIAASASPSFAAPSPLIMTTFVEDPFEGNINPGKSNGQKLFTMATAERTKDSKITVSQSEVVNVTFDC